MKKMIGAVAILGVSATCMAGEYAAYFDSVATTTKAAATDSFGPTAAIGAVFVALAIVVGLIVRARSMGKR